jgi:hypothetical protein
MVTVPLLVAYEKSCAWIEVGKANNSNKSHSRAAFTVLNGAVGFWSERGLQSASAPRAITALKRRERRN